MPVSASSTAAAPAVTTSCCDAGVTFSLHVMRLQFIETAEDSAQWAARVRRQWGAGPVVVLRASLGSQVVGLTPPQPIFFANMFSAVDHAATSRTLRTGVSSTGPGPSSMSGIDWAETVSFDMPSLSAQNSVITLETLNFASIPPQMSGIVVVNARSFVLHALSPGALSWRRPTLSQRYALHCSPIGISTLGDKDVTTHAVLVVELRATVPHTCIHGEQQVSGGNSVNASFAGVVPSDVLLDDALHGGSFVSNNSLVPTSRGPSPGRVHHSSTLCPLDFNFGPVRLSTLRLYFPTCFLNASGDYVVSNVVCAMNNTERSVLSLQLAVKSRGGERRNTAINPATLLVVNPKDAVLVRPQQRAFFSVTWGIGQNPVGFNALQESLLVQLTVTGTTTPTQPIELQVQCATPQSDENYPFHYWVNTTVLSNRAVGEDGGELAYVRSVLPVYLLLHGGGRSNDDDGSAALVVRNKDQGGMVVLRSGSSMAPVIPESSFASGFDGSATMRSALSSSTSSTSRFYDLLRRRGYDVGAPLEVPKLAVAEQRVRCVLHIGFIRGLPMVFSTSSPAAAAVPDGSAASSDATSNNTAPAFRVSLSALQPGWTVVKAETSPAYQTQSGGIYWGGDTLVAIKDRDAPLLQCLRIDLNEVNLLDDDEIPIGCALVSLPAAPNVPQVSQMLTVFYVFDSYSLYDKLNSSSLLLKDSVMELDFELPTCGT